MMQNLLKKGDHLFGATPILKAFQDKLPPSLAQSLAAFRLMNQHFKCLSHGMGLFFNKEPACLVVNKFMGLRFMINQNGGRARCHGLEGHIPMCC